VELQVGYFEAKDWYCSIHEKEEEMKGFIKDTDCKECNTCGEALDIEDDQCPDCGGVSFSTLYFCGTCQKSVKRGKEAREHYNNHYKTK
jgi:DNA-directed RNA polymerase subunit RPC12/RpoP